MWSVALVGATCLSLGSPATAYATGACCDGLCTEGLTQAQCLGVGGFYYGDGSHCTLGGLDECGACCNENTGLCVNVTSDTFDCTGPQETFYYNQQCSEITCALPGPVCGNNVREGSEACDGTDDDACAGRCRDDCTCPPPGGGGGVQIVPTVSEWGLGGLTLLMLSGVALKFGRRRAAA